ncbi:MAG: 4-hydroxy-3-methylbut-2-enyl diphosphate reductase [Elusimicrobia bacterium]|nr:4-hydroxy-3-methylbut-2-enyl diphosphate reductase [Elusimicrobiota bacterium]
MAPRRLILAKLRGFCAGVVRAIDIVEEALKACGTPVYVRKEIVHNRRVVEDLRRKGALFVDDLDEVPPGSWVIFSAHGVSPLVRKEAKKRLLKVIDATCPLVTKVHLEALQLARREASVLLIGHKDHDETIGTSGEAPGKTIVIETKEEAEKVEIADAENVGFLTQTTLSMDDTAEILTVLKRRFPKITGPHKDDICYATQNRQTAVKQMIPLIDVMLVLGAPNSSNTLRLCDVAVSGGVPAYLIENADQIRPQWLDGKIAIGLTASASAPESLVQNAIEHLKRHYGVSHVEEFATVEENVRFALPDALLELKKSKSVSPPTLPQEILP